MSAYYPQDVPGPGSDSEKLRTPSIRVKLNPELTANGSITILEEPTIESFQFDVMQCDEEVAIIQEHEKTLRSRVGLLLPEGNDMFQRMVDRYVSEGLDREGVIMAMVALKQDSSNPTKVNSFVNHYLQLKGMGFAPHIICAALIKADDTLEDAASLCLGASGS